MNKKHSSLINFLLSATVATSSLGLAACHDNDLDGNGGSSSTGEVTEQNYEKYDALSCLLGVVAEVDSLPQNWDADGFTAEPTLGEVVDASQPYVRYVATTSIEEAYREYRSMIAAGVDGTVQNEKWEQTGIGSMEFKAENQSDLYATLNVNVKQLPHLTQIRFVPASALGSNADDDKVPFYQYGDVIKQMVGDKLTYWVCVRPCDYKSGLKKSHWCSFQLVPKGKANSNYKVINDDVVLPTKLGSSYGDSQRMVQNFFNLLRVISLPSSFYQDEDKKTTGIDKISYNTFGFKQAKALYRMWTEQGLFQLIPNDGFREISTLANPFKILSNESPKLTAYYYGYKTVYFKPYDYGVYKLDLSVNADATSATSLFNVCTPSIEPIYSDQEYDFTTYENNASNAKYIIKCKTGAELEDTWGNDKASTTSFEDRTARNAISNILVSRERFNWKPSDKVSDQEERHLPFFTFGDMLQESVSHSGLQCCIKEAYDDYFDDNVKEKKKALFLCFNEDEGLRGHGVKISEKAAAVILYQMLLAIGSYGNYEFPEITKSEEEKKPENKEKYKDIISQKETYKNTLNGIFTIFNATGVLNSNNMENYFRTTHDVNSGIVKIVGNFEIGTRQLTYNYKEGTYQYGVYDDYVNTRTVKICSYDDNYSYQENYSIEDRKWDLSFNMDASPREMRAILKRFVGNFLSKCEGI